MDKRTWPPGIRPSGNGLRIRVFKHGRQVHTETYPWNGTESGIRAAVKRREYLKSRLLLGLPVDDKEPDAASFYQVAQEYMDTLAAKRSTHLSYENIINRYWMPVFATWPITEVSQRQIKKVLAGLDITPKTKKNALIPLRGILNHAGINPNPAQGIRLQRQQTAKVERYSPSERSRLLKNLNGQPAVYFSVLFGCGLRPGEALALQWADYDGEHLEISKQITRRRIEPTTKTSVRRRVYVPQWVRSVLNEHNTRFKGGYIFLNSQDGPCLDTDIFNQAWRKTHQKARIPYRIPYTCRHTRAAELLSTGVQPAAAAKQLGHSVEMFLRIYSEFIEEYAGAQDLAQFEGVTDKTLTKRKGGERDS